MNNRKESFIFHFDFINLDELTAEEIGHLTVAMIDYVREGIEPDLIDRTLRTEWRHIRQRLDADSEAYSDKCEQNRINGAKGGRPKKPNGFSQKPKKPDIQYDPHYDIDNDEKSECINKLNNINSAPTLDDIKQLCFVEDLRTNAEAFFYHYAAKQWTDSGGEPLDWKNKLREWSAHDRIRGSGTPRNGFNRFDQRDYDYKALEAALMKEG